MIDREELLLLINELYEEAWWSGYESSEKELSFSSPDPGSSDILKRLRRLLVD